MGTTSNHRWWRHPWHGAFHAHHAIPIALFAVAFGIVGYHLLHASHAATSLHYGLAPAAISLQPGEIINVAVTVNATNQATDIQAMVSYPAANVRLLAVRDLCLGHGLSGGSQDTVKTGQAVVGCKSDGRPTLSGQRTLAVMVLQATDTTTTTDQTISVSPTVQASADPTMSTADTSQQVSGRVSIKRQPVDTHKTLRAATDYHGEAVCLAPDGQPRCMAQKAVDSTGQVVAGPRATFNGYSPLQLHTAYQVPCRPGGPVAATCAAPASFGPATIGIIALGGYNGGTDALESDLQTYNQHYGLPACTQANGCLKVTNTSGAASPLPAGTDEWTAETALDAQAAHMMCQTCKILVVDTPDSTIGSGVNANAYILTQGVAAVSNSWGADNQGIFSDDPALSAKMTTTGIPILAAAGDHGNPQAGKSTVPGSYPGLIAVTGTTLKLNTDNTWASETVWNGPFLGKTVATGGGCSPEFAAPAWQTAVPNWASAGCGDKRAYGDISLEGDPNTGMVIFYSGQFYIYGGTSLATPLLAGMYGLAGPGVVPADKQAGEVLYQHMNASNSHDVTSGNNCLNDTVHCTAGPGFDTPSGLGAPNGLTGLGGPTTPAGKTGDLNGDGKINIQDLALLLVNFGSTTKLAADFNSDGKVNIQDLAVLLINFGK